MNIQDYLVPAHVAKWAKEKGFEGICDHYMWAEKDSPYLNRTANIAENHNRMPKRVSVPAFDAFFDWVEEKWGVISEIHVNFDKPNIIGHSWAVFDANAPIEGNFFPVKKRDARIAACDAIIKYIDNNQENASNKG